MSPHRAHAITTITAAIAFLVVAFTPGCGLLGGAPPTVMEAISAVDAITRLVKERWGSEAEVDIPTAGCVPAPASDAEWFGDDDEVFVYARCRGKARE